MAETADRTTPPLAAWSDALDDLPDGVRDHPASRSSRWPTCGSSPAGPAAAAVAGHLGIALPTTPSTSVENESVTAIWLGPDEWLITSRPSGPRRNWNPNSGGRRSTSAVRPCDVSAQRTTLLLRGEHVRDLLSGGCSLDLHPRVFGRGRRSPDAARPGRASC